MAIHVGCKRIHAAIPTKFSCDIPLKRWIDKRQIHISLALKKKGPLEFVNQHIKIPLKFLENSVVLTYCSIKQKTTLSWILPAS